MAIDHRALMNWQIPDARQDYVEKDCILYALGLGFGVDPRHLRHVYERDLEPLPAMALVLATGGPWLREPGTGVDYAKTVHAEQSFELHGPLPARGSMFSRSCVREVIDKGPGRGAIVISERQLFLDGADEPVATLSSSLFCRADGGFGGPESTRAKPRPLPERDPDVVMRLAVAPDLALIYRLSGDYNELHIDPEAARRAGFPAPILHGLCSFGIALRSVAEGLDIASSAITGAGVRFTAPVYPGEWLETAIWRTGTGAAFRTRAVDRDTVVLDLGWVTLA